jgi:hypothetical protein
MDRVISPELPKRPIILTIICLLGFGSFVLIWGVILFNFDTFARTSQKIGNWYFPYISFSSAIGIICFKGIWSMRKWAVYVYTLLGAINLIVLFNTNVSFITILISLVYIIMPLAYVNRMK